MKKIIKTMLALTALVACTSCVSEVEDTFDKPAAERVKDAISEDMAILTSASNGWIMNYFSDQETNKAGGCIYLLKFGTDNQVTVASGERSVLIEDIKNGDVEWSGSLPRATETSHFKIEQSAGIVLSFDEYNTIFHTYADPNNSDGTWVGDEEFRIISASADKIELVGKKKQTKIIMEPLPQGTSWDDYLALLVKATNALAFASYEYKTADGQTLSATASNNYLTINYKDEAGTAMSKGVPFLIKPDGYYLYEPTELFGSNVSVFKYNGDATFKDKTFTSDDGKSTLAALVLPLSESLLNSNYYIAYENLCPTLKAYWDIAIPKLKTVEGERLMYAYFAKNELYFRSGNYWGGIDFGAEANGEDQITYKIVGWTGTDAQKSNGSYYWGSKDADGNTYFPYFFYFLQGTWQLKTKNVSNPKIITLTNTEDPTLWFKLQADAVYATPAE